MNLQIIKLILNLYSSIFIPATFLNILIVRVNLFSRYKYIKIKLLEKVLYNMYDQFWKI